MNEQPLPPPPEPADPVDEASIESFPASDPPAWGSSPPRPADDALEVLVDDDPTLPALPLGPELGRRYGGRLGLRTPSLYANFVSSVDGVVALGEGHSDPGGQISGHNRMDRFVMGVLRASADAVLLGAGTLRDTPRHRWTPQAIFPELGAEFAELRTRLGRTGQPRLVLVTASGGIDPDHPGLEENALVLTTGVGEERLRGRLPAAVALRSLGAAADLSAARIMEAVRGEGHSAVLTEGGPTLIGHLLRGGVLDELFLTVSPLLAGRTGDATRPGLVDGVAFDPPDAPWMRLVSVRRHRAHLFLRYRMTQA